mmetsp:Transcript_3917/g.10050  ORF Transcript_3917/g.10050 Transcript_3917/m.10050 type:complete len:92 (-) Transcript_3917:151-426(-)
MRELKFTKFRSYLVVEFILGLLIPDHFTAIPQLLHTFFFGFDHAEHDVSQILYLLLCSMFRFLKTCSPLRPASVETSVVSAESLFEHGPRH